MHLPHTAGPALTERNWLDASNIDDVIRSNSFLGRESKAAIWGAWRKPLWCIGVFLGGQR